MAGRFGHQIAVYAADMKNRDIFFKFDGPYGAVLRRFSAPDMSHFIEIRADLEKPYPHVTLRM